MHTLIISNVYKNSKLLLNNHCGQVKLKIISQFVYKHISLCYHSEPISPVIPRCK